MSAFRGKVLVVDDEVNVCRLIERVLQGQSVECRSAFSGEEAKRRLLSDEYDVVVLDLLMAGVTGLEVLRFISEQQLPTRAICISGGQTEQIRSAALEAGAYEFLPKPLDMPHLAESVAHAIAERRGGGAMVCSDSASAGQAVGVGSFGLRGWVKKGLDEVTGLPSFAALRKELPRIRQSCGRRHVPSAAMIVGLDAFATVNAEHGYDFGDRVLAELAGRIHDCVGSKGLLARGGGDEFVVFLPDCRAPQAVELARKICQAVGGSPVTCESLKANVTASLGLATAEEDLPLREAELLERARLAMKSARAVGGNCVMEYTSGMGNSLRGVRRWAGLPEPAVGSPPMLNQVRRTVHESAEALVQVVEAKDPYTRRHSEHVAQYAVALARHVRMEHQQVECIHVAALLHDIGKIAVPDFILTKPGSLTEREFDLVRQHPTVGADILENISLLKAEATLIRFHHENWDGTGYPAGLAAEQIPIGSRIINIADSMDAMLMHRAYRRAYPVEKMLQELQRCGGKQFDPDLAQAAVDWCRHNTDKLILPRQRAESETA